MATMAQLYETFGVFADRIRPADLEALNTKRFQEQIIKQPATATKGFLSFLAEMVASAFTLAAIERDMTGWKLLEPAPSEEGEFEPTIHEFLKEEDNGCCGGEEMVKRAKEQGALTGLRHAEAMLRNQERIPVEWRKFVLVFVEVWQGPDGGRDVWCLYWRGRRWCLGYGWLGLDFYSSYRLVASRKYQKPLDT